MGSVPNLTRSKDYTKVEMLAPCRSSPPTPVFLFLESPAVSQIWHGSKGIEAFEAEASRKVTGRFVDFSGYHPK